MGWDRGGERSRGAAPQLATSHPAGVHWGHVRAPGCACVRVVFMGWVGERVGGRVGVGMGSTELPLNSRHHILHTGVYAGLRPLRMGMGVCLRDLQLCCVALPRHASTTMGTCARSHGLHADI